MTNWLDEQTQLLSDIDSSWARIKTTLTTKSRCCDSSKRQQLANWFDHLSHIFEELKQQQNWDPTSLKRKKFLDFLRANSILKSQYPAVSPIWTSSAPVLPVSSSVQCMTIYGYYLYVSGQDFWSITATGYYKQELSESLIILRLLPHVNVFIDVGANIGFYSLLAAKTGNDNLSVFAFEPESENYHKIEQAVYEQNLQNKIRTFPIAIGSTSQKLKLYLCSRGSGGNSVAPPKGVKMSEEYKIVESTTLDEIQKNHFPHFPPTLIKIDIETFEYEAIRGAHNWLANPKAPIVIFEADEQSQNSRKNHIDIIKKLRSYGYKVFPVLEPLNGKAPLGKERQAFRYKSPTINYLALPPHRFSLLKILQAPIDIRAFTQRDHLQALLKFLNNSLESLENA